jgi:hypothetical protein
MQQPPSVGRLTVARERAGVARLSGRPCRNPRRGRTAATSGEFSRAAALPRTPRTRRDRAPPTVPAQQTRRSRLARGGYGTEGQRFESSRARSESPACRGFSRSPPSRLDRLGRGEVPERSSRRRGARRKWVPPGAPMGHLGVPEIAEEDGCDGRPAGRAQGVRLSPHESPHEQGRHTRRRVSSPLR